MPVLIVSLPRSFRYLDEEVLNVRVKEEGKGDASIQNRNLQEVLFL